MNPSIRLLALTVLAVGLTACSKSRDLPVAKKVKPAGDNKPQAEKCVKGSVKTSAETAVVGKDDSQTFAVHIANVDTCETTTFTKTFGYPIAQSTEFAKLSLEGVPSDQVYVNTLGTSGAVFMVFANNDLNPTKGAMVYMFNKAEDGTLALTDSFAVDNDLVTATTVVKDIVETAAQTGKSVSEVVQLQLWRDFPGETPGKIGPQ